MTENFFELVLLVTKKVYHFHSGFIDNILVPPGIFQRCLSSILVSHYLHYLFYFVFGFMVGSLSLLPNDKLELLTENL